MTSPKVSIIIPCFNVEKYLEQCLNSLINQTLKEIELIIVNDGSTDGTLAIIQRYQTIDPRINIIDKKNSGYGDSLNQAIDRCRGEYIGIVESDDFVEREMFEILYKTAISHQLDVCRCAYFYHKNKTDTIQNWHFVPKNIVLTPRVEKAVFKQAPSVWANLYNREWLNQHHIRFLPTPGASFQDLAFSFKAYYFAERFLMIDTPLLHYRLDNSSSSVHNPNKVFCVCSEWDEIYRLLRNEPKNIDMLSFLPQIQHQDYIWNLGRIAQEYKRDFLKHWQKEAQEHLALNETRLSKLPLAHKLIELFVLHCPLLLLLYNKDNKAVQMLKSFVRPG